MIRYLLPLLLLSVTVAGAEAGGPLGDEWETVGEGTWSVTGRNPQVVWQGNIEGATKAVNLNLDGPGNVWRCLVEPGINAKNAGIWFGAARDLSRGFLLTLGGAEAGGVELRDAEGSVLWQDKYAPWTSYTPYMLEGVVEPGRVRVQMLRWDRETLLAQSDWIVAPGAEPRADDVLALHTDSSIARFYRWERANTPLSPIVPDSPTKMRLTNDKSGTWVIVGDGDWRWTSADKKAIRQGATVERSTAVNTSLGGAEGTWQCRVQVDKGAGGSGLVLLTDEKAQRGFLVWLGGTYGDGGLMLYRLPLEALWSSPQGKWRYDTEYVLEGAIQGAKISARMLHADADTVIAASPEFDLTEEEKDQTGFIGFQTWKGTAEFWGFSEQTRATPVETVAATPSPLGEEWRVLDGQWKWRNPEKSVLEGIAKDGAATALCLNARGARCLFRCRAVPKEGTQSVSLLFQVNPDLSQGFECRLENGVLLQSLDGRELWRKDDFAWKTGKAYILEGIVVTDRVSVRVLDDAGKALLRSEECYVTQTNNDREGLIGFRIKGASAEFSEWSVTPSE